MERKFDTRKYGVSDFEEWHDKGDLILQARFQRREVWSPKARSFLIDTIIRGKPIPKIYMRQDINPSTRRTVREIVDGQQRLRSVLDYLKDGFPIYKTHNEKFGGKLFSELDKETQKQILAYEFAVDLLQDMPDREVYDVFARLNTYSITLNAQELRNAKWFGEFKTSAYQLGNEFNSFWLKNGVFTAQQILRMAEVEFVSELLIASAEGIKAKTKRYIDNYYKDHDDQFPRRQTCKNRLTRILDTIGAIFADSLTGSRFSEPRLLYPLYCALFHMKYGLPSFQMDRIGFKVSAYAKIRTALASVNDVFLKVEHEAQMLEREKSGEVQEGEDDLPHEDIDPEAEFEQEFDPLTPNERRFHAAYIEHWVHAENRRIRTEFISELILSALDE